MDDQELLNNKEQVVDNDDGLKEMQKALKAQADFENALDSGSLKMKDFAVLKEFFKYLKPYLGKFLFGLSQVELWRNSRFCCCIYLHCCNCSYLHVLQWFDFVCDRSICCARY